MKRIPGGDVLLGWGCVLPVGTGPDPGPRSPLLGWPNSETLQPCSLSLGFCLFGGTGPCVALPSQCEVQGDAIALPLMPGAQLAVLGTLKGTLPCTQRAP